MKIILLTPCKMGDNNRKANNEAMRYARQHYDVDEVIVNAQCFQDFDFEQGVKYIGLHDEGVGFVKARNELLAYFYASDADYAVWMDANAKVSKPTLNDFNTVLAAVRRGDLMDVDAVFCTLGIIMNGDRILAKQTASYGDEVYLMDSKACDWMHGLIMKNFKKYYGEEPYIDERCDPYVGTSEDAYFARLLKSRYCTKVAPTVVVSKPSAKTSTWMKDAGSYAYAKLDYETIDAYVKESPIKVHKPKSLFRKTIHLSRIERYKELIKPYKAKTRVKKGLL